MDEEVEDTRPRWKKVVGWTIGLGAAALFVWVVISSVVLAFVNWLG